MATIRKRGNRYQVEVRRGSYRRSRTFTKLTTARQWAQDIEDRIDAGRSDVRHTVSQAFRKYAEEVSPKKKGEKWEVVRLNNLIETASFAPMMIDMVTGAEIAAWRNQRLTEVEEPTSVRREMKLLQSVFKVAMREWCWIDSNPVTQVDKPKNKQPREQTISDEQFWKLAEVVGYQRGVAPQSRAQLTMAGLDLAIATAMRAGELTSLTSQTMHIEQRYVDLIDTKNNTSRQVPLNRVAVEVLSSLDPDNPFPVTSDNMSTVFRRIRKKAGLFGAFTFHDSRATAITKLAKKIDIHDLARITGHSDLRSLMGYYRETASEIADRMDDDPDDR